MDCCDRFFKIGTVPLLLIMESSPDSVNGPATVLFVDDDLSFIGMLKRTFAGHSDHRIMWFTDPSVALERFARDPDGIDLVITDYNMPRLTGNELARCLRVLNPAIRIVGTSSNIDQFDLDLLDLIIVKTHKKHVLIEAMEKVLVK